MEEEYGGIPLIRVQCESKDGITKTKTGYLSLTAMISQGEKKTGGKRHITEPCLMYTDPDTDSDIWVTPSHFVLDICGLSSRRPAWKDAITHYGQYIRALEEEGTIILEPPGPGCRCQRCGSRPTKKKKDQIKQSKKRVELENETSLLEDTSPNEANETLDGDERGVNTLQHMASTTKILLSKRKSSRKKDSNEQGSEDVSEIKWTVSKKPKLDLPSNQLPCNNEINLCSERMQDLLSSGVRCLNPASLKQQLSGSAQSRDRLRTNITAAGLCIYEAISGDGNCFFHAVSSQLYRIKKAEMGHQELRAQVVTRLRVNTLFFVDDVQVDLADFMTESKADYCERMSRDGVWADHVAVIATAHYLQTDILIVTSSPESGPDNNISWIAWKSGFSGDPLLLGHVWENHYESLTQKEDAATAELIEVTSDECDDTSDSNPKMYDKATTSNGRVKRKSTLRALSSKVSRDQVSSDKDEVETEGSTINTACLVKRKPTWRETSSKLSRDQVSSDKDEVETEGSTINTACLEPSAMQEPSMPVAVTTPMAAPTNIPKAVELHTKVSTKPSSLTVLHLEPQTATMDRDVVDIDTSFTQSSTSRPSPTGSTNVAKDTFGDIKELLNRVVVLQGNFVTAEERRDVEMRKMVKTQEMQTEMMRKTLDLALSNQARLAEGLSRGTENAVVGTITPLEVKDEEKVKENYCQCDSSLESLETPTAGDNNAGPGDNGP